MKFMTRLARHARPLRLASISVGWTVTTLGFALMLASGAGCNGTAGTRVGVDAAPASNNGPAEVMAGQFMNKDAVKVLEAQLTSGTLNGWVHAAKHQHALYVFTWRAPNDFFTSYDFPIYPATADVTRQLEAVKRHDQVRIKGRYITNGAPIQHIVLESLQVVRAYAAGEAATPRTPATEIPKALMNKRALIGKVHALAEEGNMMVIEYGDAVVPVFVKDPSLTRDLYRNDKLRVAYEIAPRPASPTHLWLDTGAAKPIEVLESMLERHNKPADEEGILVKFPQSPQIAFDVYALQVTDADGISREYTLVNEDSTRPEIFQTIRRKCADAWDLRKSAAIDGRNKLVNPQVRVRAQGKWNVIARNQANVQILVPSADGVTLTVQ